MALAARDASARLDALRRRVDLYERVILAQAEESLASAEAAYSTNRQGFLDLLDAERVLFEVRLNHQQLRADARLAVVDLERALGRPLVSPVMSAALDTGSPRLPAVPTGTARGGDRVAAEATPSHEEIRHD